MNAQTLIISYARSTAEVRDWVRLEQIVPKGAAAKATLRDVHTLWLAAATGHSARLIRSMNCPVAFVGTTIKIYLGLYAWPSRPDLVYQLSPAMGTLTGRQQVRKLREFSLFVENQSAVTLDWYLEAEGLQIDWETPTFDRNGAVIPPPTVTLVDGIRLVFSAEVFGGLRIKGMAVGDHYTCEMAIEKAVTQEANTATASLYPEGVLLFGVTPATVPSAPKITDLKNTITASWQVDDKTETEQLVLELPSCVQALLEMCPDMYQTFLLLCQDGTPLLVFYNACTGEIIAEVDDVQNRQLFCVDISNLKRPQVNPYGFGVMA